MSPEILEVASIFAILTGVTWAVKMIFLGRGPVRRRTEPAHIQAMEQRITEVEDRLDHQLAAMEEGYRGQLSDLEERLDFAERMLAQQKRQGELPAAPDQGVATPN
jgi:hypothetical protein